MEIAYKYKYYENKPTKKEVFSDFENDEFNVFETKRRYLSLIAEAIALENFEAWDICDYDKPFFIAVRGIDKGIKLFEIELHHYFNADAEEVDITD